jgi:hypothetical protein
MANGQTEIELLHKKSMETVHLFKELPEKDIRRKHFEILSTQIVTSLVNLRINHDYSIKNKVDFEALLENDMTKIDNYIYHFNQNLLESIFDTTLFQTELIFRFYYSKLTGKTLTEEKLHKIVATLFQDTENNWTKEEAKFVILFWTLRNTVHTGGIYFNKTEGYSTTCKGIEYKFEYGKAPNFLKDGHTLTMVSNLFDSVIYLFNSDLIKDLGTFDHPNYFALEQ